jgi:alpha-galactosidase
MDARTFHRRRFFTVTEKNMAGFMNCQVVIASLLCFAPTMPCALAVAQEAPQLLTPAPPPVPHINGPKVYGARPGHPFLYRIPCTGMRPMHFSAKDLPSSLKLDEASGIISGNAPADKGEFAVTLKAANSLGTVSRPFKIIVGEKLGLTPQMGWNDWYTHYAHPTDTDIRKAADAMIASGMADYGYQFVDIDDAWARKPGSTDADLGGQVRDEAGNILPNGRFPSMPGLTEYIHSLGLKAGIYSGPGPLTCAKFEASYKHEDADAHQFARWGFDLLKYDMCSYRNMIDQNNLAELQKPYKLMGSILAGLDRDVVFNMCQYGKGDVWKWGRQIGGSSWRTTGDLGLAADDSLPGFYSIGLANAALDAYAGPGGWNDPDYILIGNVGDAHNKDAPAKPTKLTPDEQYSYMSMWSLMVSPLFFSGDMAKLDDFTLNILCNSEVIDIDQDSLGKQGKVIRKTSLELVLAKPLEDGSVAVGLFNLSKSSRTVSVDWKELDKRGHLAVRDLWRQRDLGKFEDRFGSAVPAHGVVLIRIEATHKRP